MAGARRDEAARLQRRRRAEGEGRRSQRGDVDGRVGDVDIDRAGVGRGVEDAQRRGSGWRRRRVLVDDGGAHDAAAFVGDEHVVGVGADARRHRRQRGARGRVVDLQDRAAGRRPDIGADRIHWNRGDASVAIDEQTDRLMRQRRVEQAHAGVVTGLAAAAAGGQGDRDQSRGDATANLVIQHFFSSGDGQRDRLNSRWSMVDVIGANAAPEGIADRVRIAKKCQRRRRRLIWHVYGTNS